ncbi:5-methylcytosine-specific restriction endonuclease McrA [Streptomyces sp. TLI_053]|uniref:hypothetical protein n=1 Tax=Streptomyces sp. TLI_053 TaxID=1855352 RepID=UPI00087DF472|nr:hypothetical protein [Streptomyces sp. TLI_053]SDT59489.1 5-methylcytosine-specific restriction endonuclease McrA [Streptomyces sp. TLI_053]
MIPLQRGDLPPEVESSLHRLTAEVMGSGDRLRTAKLAWKRESFRRDTYPPVLECLRTMAHGTDCCMYCGHDLADQIDHFVPVVIDPARTFSWPNHLLACGPCNTRFKNRLFEVDEAGRPLLIDPTAEDPFRHLHLVLSTGEYLGIDDRGDYTIATVGLNREKRPEARRQAMAVTAFAIEKWWSARTDGDRAAVDTAASVVRGQPFAGVFQSMLRQAVRAEADLFFEGVQGRERLLTLLRDPVLRSAFA